MCVIALVMFYETGTTNPMKVFRVLSFVVYYIIDLFFELTVSVVSLKRYASSILIKYSRIGVIMNCLVFKLQKC